MTGDFWQLIIEALNDNKEDLQKQADSEDLKELSPEQYKLENELLKAKRKYLDKLSELPATLISWLKNPNTEKPESFDPYDK